MTVHNNFYTSYEYEIRDVFLVCVFHTFQTIWMVRNFVQYNDAKIFLHAAKAKISTFVAMSGNYSSGCLPIDANARLLDNFLVFPCIKHYMNT
jgi:hypothetical protein